MGRDRPRSRPAFGPSAPPQSNRRLIMRSDIEVGAQFPDYELSDHAGEQRKLSEVQGTNMMVLHLARGGYDPKEHRFLRHFADAYPEFKTAYTRLAVITTTTNSTSTSFGTPSEQSGHSSRILSAPCRRISTLRSTPIPTTRWSRILLCSSRACGSSRSTTATGIGAVPHFTSCASTYGTC